MAAVKCGNCDTINNVPEGERSAQCVACDQIFACPKSRMEELLEAQLAESKRATKRSKGRWSNAIAAILLIVLTGGLALPLVLLWYVARDD